MLSFLKHARVFLKGRKLLFLSQIFPAGNGIHIIVVVMHVVLGTGSYFFLFFSIQTRNNLQYATGIPDGLTCRTLGLQRLIPPTVGHLQSVLSKQESLKQRVEEIMATSARLLLIWCCFYSPLSSPFLFAGYPLCFVIFLHIDVFNFMALTGEAWLI